MYVKLVTGIISPDGPEVCGCWCSQKLTHTNYLSDETENGTLETDRQEEVHDEEVASRVLSG